MLGNTEILQNKTFADACKRYALEVSTTKKGERWKVIRINAMINHPIMIIPLPRLTTDKMQGWINERSSQVSNGTV